MKSALLLIFILPAAKLFAQIPGYKVDGPVQINDSLWVREGDTLKLGTGSSGSRGDFRYIYIPANALLGSMEESLNRTYAGKYAVIKHFKKWEHKKSGTKIYTVINLGGLNEVVELGSAIETGEIVAINGKRVGPTAERVAVVNQASSTSAADEIRKLKALMDEGIITKEEFEAQKKKLLEKQ
jgi:hypothetical protein